jgi:hypothetical protein
VTRRLRIFISAAPDLEVEREAVGKAIASLPVSLGWVINYTPGRGEPLAPAFEAAAASDFYVLLLGMDIRAPVGSELVIARQSGKRILRFLKDVARTPAARVFVRDIRLEWNHFATAAELGPLLKAALAEQIVEGAQAYGISVLDWERLSAFLAESKSQEASERVREEIAPDYRGAGKDGVIVAPGRDLPEEGVLIERPET